MEDFILIADENCGIYCAQQFAQSIDFERVSGIADLDWQILLAGPNGPDYQDYFDIWDDQIEEITVDVDGRIYGVYNNVGIWLYPLDQQDSIDWESLSF